GMREDAERIARRQHAEGLQVEALRHAVDHDGQIDLAELVLAEPERLAHLAGPEAPIDRHVEPALLPVAELLGREDVRVAAGGAPGRGELDFARPLARRDADDRSAPRRRRRRGSCHESPPSDPHVSLLSISGGPGAPPRYPPIWFSRKRRWLRNGAP